MIVLIFMVVSFALGSWFSSSGDFQGNNHTYCLRIYFFQRLNNMFRGTDTADMWGQTMRANALTMDDTTMVNVLAYIQTLRQASR